MNTNLIQEVKPRPSGYIVYQYWRYLLFGTGLSLLICKDAYCLAREFHHRHFLAILKSFLHIIFITELDQAN